jgi:hypothetical protein
VLVVWEPILWTDLKKPSGSILARLSDLRVVQFWDHDHLVAQTLRESLPSGEGTAINPAPLSDSILWDVVGIYPPGKRWTDKLPTASFFDGPVNDVISRVKEVLEQPVMSGSL